MNEFLSLKCLGSSDAVGNSLHPSPSSSNEIICRSPSNFPVPEKVHDNQYPDDESSSHFLHRRSHSLSSCAISSGYREGNCVSLSDLHRPASSCGNSPHRASSCQLPCHPLTPERDARSKSSEQSPSHHPNPVQKHGSPSSSRYPETSSVNSPFCSPIPSRYNVASRPPKRNECLDQHVDGEDEELKPETPSGKCLSESGVDCFLAENGNKAFRSLGRSQPVQSSAFSSLTYDNENVRTYSLREEKDSFHHPSVSAFRLIGKSKKKPSIEFPGKLTLNSRDDDSESTMTFEDIYMDSSEMQPTSHSEEVLQHHSMDCYPHYRKLNGYFSQELLGLQKHDHFLENRIMDNTDELKDSDEELVQKLKDIERMVELLPDEDFDLEELHNSDLDAPLFHAITNTKDRKYLASELSSQIKCRIAERCAAKRQLRQARMELKTRTRRMEREKNELQFSLNKELDRRSSDWSLKLEMIRLEEQRLQEQVEELEEQNACFQSEISSLKSRDCDEQNRTMNSDIGLTNLTECLEKIGNKNYSLQKALSVHEHFSAIEKDRDCIRRCLHDKESENKELQKLVIRLQRTCDEQEKAINGLLLGYSNEIENKSTEKSDQITRLQMEQIRLTGIEQNLRKELKTCQHELETLRQENISLLTRLQAAGNGYQFSSIKLEQELHARVDQLQTEGLSLLNDIIHFNEDLLEFLKHKKFEQGQEVKTHPLRYPFEYTIKKQGFSRRYENLRRSLQTIATILDDKSDSYAMVCESLHAEGGMAKKSEDELEIKLREEIMLTRLLREKLYSNELELDRLEAELASSIRVHDVLHTEIQRMQDEVSCLTHKTTDMEIKMLRKDESIKQLENDHQECKKELTAARNMFLKVTEERNHMWEEVKSSREKTMLLNYEVVSLQKKIEQLEEDILTKDGQISILRDSLAKPFDFICSPRSVKDFSLE
ncbi:hypothetical protein Cni_G25895 [Canna indica]|uniref:DUF7653 domain-containing protein n=1 Tax=Canna indica TaxID=4628 RepID=A0AAQ3QLG7_9LILI|nr:hypothetical protein Cni_G25895 [Canna indica]